MKKILFSALMLLMINVTYAQIVPIIKPEPVKQKGKYGFTMCGQQVITAKYDSVSVFYPCRLALARIGDKTFAIDVNGKKVSKDFVKINYIESLCLFEGKAEGMNSWTLYDIDFNPITPENKETFRLNSNIRAVRQDNNTLDFVTLDGTKIFSIEADGISPTGSRTLINGHKVIGPFSPEFTEDMKLQYRMKYKLTHLGSLQCCGIEAKKGKQNAYFDFKGNNLTGYFDNVNFKLHRMKKKYFGNVIKTAEIVDKYYFDDYDEWEFRRKQILKAENLYPLYPGSLKNKPLVPDNVAYSDLVNYIYPLWSKIAQDPSLAAELFNSDKTATGDVSYGKQETIKAFNSFGMGSWADNLMQSYIYDNMTNYCYSMPEVYAQLVNAKGMIQENEGNLANALRCYEFAETYGCNEATDNKKQLIKKYKARKREELVDKFITIGNFVSEVTNAYLAAASESNDSEEGTTGASSSKKTNKGTTVGQHAKDCRVCLGTGNCQQCNGDGVIVFQSYRRQCDACKGQVGKCHSCKGKGKRN